MNLPEEREHFAKKNLQEAYKGTELTDENGETKAWPDPTPKDPVESEVSTATIEAEIKEKRLNRQQLNLTTALSMFYWENAELPSNEKLAELTGRPVEWVKKNLREPIVVDALRARGIYTEDFSASYLGGSTLTAQQTATADLMLNLADKRTKREKLKQVGVSTSRYYAWLNNPAFKEYMNKRARELFGAHEHDAYLAVLKSVESGSLEAAKFYLELSGIYNPKIKVEVDVNHIVQQVVEIVLSRVTDPETVRLIANDLASLTQQTSPVGVGGGLGQTFSPLALPNGR